jgi:hypothetical protein
MPKPKIKAELDYLISEFNLQFIENISFLSDWIQTENCSKLDDVAESVLAKVEPHLAAEIGSWLEEDLKMSLLSVIFLLAEIKEYQRIGVFFERPIFAEIENVSIKVIADCVISSVYGFASPKTPYFFMQEFKKSKGDKQDPEGQMLAAMIAGQHLNNNGKVMYGSYVVGAFWYFTVLEGKNYSRSDAFQLTKPIELRQVILTLRKLKQIILNDLTD